MFYEPQNIAYEGPAPYRLEGGMLDLYYMDLY